MQKPFFRDPPTLLYQLLVHDGNLASRAAEADETKFEPEPEGLGEGNWGRRFKQMGLRSYVSRNWRRLFV
jgi:hypothetical protein